MPTVSGAFYLVHPVQFDGGIGEGSAASPHVDTSRSIPVVVLGSRQVAAGDYLVCHSLGGRWVAEGGSAPSNCRPKCGACPGAVFAVAGTVTDAVNGAQPMVYDYPQAAWFSPWLPFVSPYVLGAGDFDPSPVGTGTCYYFYKLSCTSPGQPAARLYLPRTTYDGQPVYYNMTGPEYPASLDRPADMGTVGFLDPSAGPPSSCDPLAFAATWSGVRLPLTAAAFEIPRIAIPSYGETCVAPCPLPRRDLTVSWTNTGGNGSGTLVYTPDHANLNLSTWNLACTEGLTIRLSISDGEVGFAATVWDTADCTGVGTAHPFDYPGAIRMDSYSCEPLELVFSPIFTASLLYTSGYRSFAVTL